MRLPTLLLLCTLCGLSAAAEGGPEINGIPVPPSPGDPQAHPGKRLWQPPRFTHYPLVVYASEDRNLAFRLPVPPDRARDRAAGLDRPEGAYHNPFGWGGGDRGTIGWRGGKPLPLELPVDPELERVSGLLPLPTSPGTHVAELRIGELVAELPLRLVPVAGPWPHQRLEQGYPVDAENRPVVLIDQRRDAAAERQWSALRSGQPRPDGRPLVVGDPLAAPDGHAWEGLADVAELRPLTSERYPHHALAVAVAQLPDPLPRTIVWSPGNAPVLARMPAPEEERILGALRNRLEHQGARPRLVLVLPPWPAEPERQAEAAERRALLRRSAQFVGWEVVDAAAAAGDPATANRIADGVSSRHPTGPARLAVRDAVRAVLED